MIWNVTTTVSIPNVKGRENEWVPVSDCEFRSIMASVTAWRNRTLPASSSTIS